MNSSLITADKTTHLKILAVALVACTSIVWIGIGARIEAGDMLPTIEKFLSNPAMPLAEPPSIGKTATTASVA